MSDKQPDALRSLYEVTGAITDVNTLLVNRSDYESLRADAERYRAMRSIALDEDIETFVAVRLSYGFADEAEFDAAIDAAMKDKQ